MAPGKIEPDSITIDTFVSSSKPPISRPRIYLLEVFSDAVIQYCQNFFDTILATDPESSNWRENAEFLLLREKTISADDIAAARKLRAIGKQGTGIDIIDQEACKKRGIPILNTPGVNAQSVAELVLTLTMAVARELRTISVKQAAGVEVRKEHCRGVTMTDRAIGILGMGHIGTAVARIFYGAFRSRIYVYDPSKPPEAWSDIPHVRVKRYEEMLPLVDVLTVHVPLNAKTRGMIALQHFQVMKPTAILINVARGGIVNEVDLAVALEEGLIWGAGIDCHEEEPPTLQRYSRLWNTGKVISTPHIGATTDDMQTKTAKVAIDNVYRFLQAK